MLNVTTPMDNISTDVSECPIDHIKYSRQKTKFPHQMHPNAPRIEQDSNGVWTIHGYEEARQILRGPNTKQAGFNADAMSAQSMIMNQPILYLEGKVHDEQRKRTARFFTPRTVSSSYHQFMEKYADELIARIRREKRFDLSKLSMTLAVKVANQVVGTDSRLPGVQGRIEALFSEEPAIKGPKFLAPLLGLISSRHMIAFYILDAMPSIQAHKRHPKEDVISHLVQQNYSNPEIMAEVIVYAAAGMATTREFISVAAWHMLEHPELLKRYLVTEDEERYAILHETLRIEPVVSRISRRATDTITIQSEGKDVIIPAGALIHIDIHDSNEDMAVVGEDPRALCPAREMHTPQVQEMVMSFGDGPHRCAGAYVAIQESDIFLRKLLSLDGLHIEKQPNVTYNDLVSGYEIRDFILAL